MAVGFGLRAFKARLPPGSLGAGCGFRFALFASARFRRRGWKPCLPAEDFAFLRARVPDARLETASTGGVSGLRALRARVLHGSHGI